VDGLYFHEEAYNVDQLLEQVINARESYQTHVDTIAQAVELAKEHSIGIHQQNHPGTTQKTWRVTIPALEYKHPYRADNANELLRYVKETIEHKAQQEAVQQQ